MSLDSRNSLEGPQLLTLPNSKRTEKELKLQPVRISFEAVVVSGVDLNANDRVFVRQRV